MRKGRVNGIEIQYRKIIETAFLLDALTSSLSTVTPLMNMKGKNGFVSSF
jgi:hypothetical protein